jgi:hypothetical protein
MFGERPLLCVEHIAEELARLAGKAGDGYRHPQFIPDRLDHFPAVTIFGGDALCWDPRHTENHADRRWGNDRGHTKHVFVKRVNEPRWKSKGLEPGRSYEATCDGEVVEKGRIVLHESRYAPVPDGKPMATEDARFTIDEMLDAVQTRLEAQ